jgi:hypothetical protein
MRTETAAKLSAMSSASAVMRLTLTPAAGESSKRVTVGPWAMPISRVEMPKLASASISFLPLNSSD